MVPFIVLSFDSFATEDVDHEALWLVAGVCGGSCSFLPPAWRVVYGWPMVVYGWLGFAWSRLRMAGNTNSLETDQSSFLFYAHPDVRHGTRLGVPSCFGRQVLPAPVVGYVTPRSAVTHAHTSLFVVLCLQHPPLLMRLQLPQEQRCQQYSQQRQRQVSKVQTVQKPVEIPRLQILGQGTHREDCAEARGYSTIADLGQSL